MFLVWWDILWRHYCKFTANCFTILLQIHSDMSLTVFVIFRLLIGFCLLCSVNCRSLLASVSESVLQWDCRCGLGTVVLAWLLNNLFLVSVFFGANDLNCVDVLLNPPHPLSILFFFLNSIKNVRDFGPGCGRSGIRASSSKSISGKIFCPDLRICPCLCSCSGRQLFTAKSNETSHCLSAVMVWHSNITEL